VTRRGQLVAEGSVATHVYIDGDGDGDGPDVITAALAVCVSAHQSTVLTLAIRLGGLAIGAYLTARRIRAARQRMVVAASLPGDWSAVPGEEARGRAVVGQ
jgi:hypothetical protein